jgi:hypothetical protein
MGWMRFLTVVFNLLGALFLIAAAVTFLLGVAVGGAAGANPNEGAALGAFMGGMMGTVAAVSNFFAALAMFFFGAVLWALRRLLEEAHLHHPQRPYS